ncbi:MAG: GNAT family N-acetyltransferase [Actinomycetes bacterium]
MSTADDPTGPPAPDDLLTAHLRAWVGTWPPAPGRVTVVAHAARDLPGWDGAPHRVVGVSDLQGTVLAVPPAHAEAIRTRLADAHGPDALDDLDLARDLGAVAGGPGHLVGTGVFRTTTADEVAPADVLPDAGVWLPTSDPRVPEWLRPFGHEVLVALDDDGAYGAGVGVKRHDPWGRELAVVTEERLRGRGIARRLVAQAARRVLADGHVPTYLHARDNAASAAVADAVGFADRGWRVHGLFRVAGGD